MLPKVRVVRCSQLNSGWSEPGVESWARRTRRAAIGRIKADALASARGGNRRAGAGIARRDDGAGRGRLEQRAMRPVAVEAEVQLGEAEVAPVIDREIDAVGEDPAGIRRHEGDAGGGGRIAVEAAGNRVAVEQEAERVGRARRRHAGAVIVAEAIVDDVLRGRLRDRVRDQDMIIIDRDRQARDEAGLQHHADRVAVGGFRTQVERAGGDRIGLARGRVLDQADRARRRALREADRAQIGIVDRVRAAARIGRQRGQANDGRREQFVDVGGANRALEIAAEAGCRGSAPRCPPASRWSCCSWASPAPRPCSSNNGCPPRASDSRNPAGAGPAARSTHRSLPRPCSRH